MSRESKAAQLELRERQTDSLPFDDDAIIIQVTRVIAQSSFGRTISFPFALTQREIDKILQRLKRHGSPSVTFEPVRTKDGMGTNITVRRKGR